MVYFAAPDGTADDSGKEGENPGVAPLCERRVCAGNAHEPIRSTSDFWKDFFFPTTGKTIPKDKMITKKIDLKALDPAKDIVVWMGHSSFYMQLHGKKILIDPRADTYAADLVYR